MFDIIAKFVGSVEDAAVTPASESQNAIDLSEYGKDCNLSVRVRWCARDDGRAYYETTASVVARAQARDCDVCEIASALVDCAGRHDTVVMFDQTFWRYLPRDGHFAAVSRDRIEYRKSIAADTTGRFLTSAW